MSSLNQKQSRPESRDCQGVTAPPLAGVSLIKRGGLPPRTPKSLLLLFLVLLALFSCDYLFDIAPPEIEIIEPQEGVSYFGILPVDLDVTDNNKVDRVEIFLGDESVYVFTNEPFTENLNIPKYGRIPTVLKVVAYDHVGNWAEAQRDIGVPQGLKLISPNGGEFWPETSNQTISWAAYGDAGSSVILHYSLDGGATWIEIDDDVPNDGSYYWTLPDIAETKIVCRVRVSSTTTGHYDISDGNFTIGCLTLIGSYDTPGDAKGVFVSGSYAYVADGERDLQIINVSNPASLTLIGSYNTPLGAKDVFVSGGYAYVANYGIGLQIIDVSNPAAPTMAGSYGRPGYAMGVFVSGGYAYVADDRSGLQIINVSNPASPTLAGAYDTPSYAIDVFVTGGYAYVADHSSGLQIISVSNPASPTLAGSYDTPDWALGVFVSGSYAYVADGYSGLQIIDVSNPASPTLAGTYNTPGQAWGVSVSGSYAYVADQSGGLQIIDVSNPASPTLSGIYDTPDYAKDVFVSGGYAYVADGWSGLLILDVSGLP